MKKGCLKKVFGIVLCFSLIFTFLSFTASARYQYITILQAGLAINSSGLATCSGLVKSSDSSTSTTLTVELQKYSSGWKYDDSWNTSGKGTASIPLTAQKYVGHGLYRVVVTAKVYSSSGTLLETQSVLSNEVTY
jgi:hypothetical protein